MSGPQDGRVIEKSSDKTWSTAGGKGNPLQYCLENPMNSMKKQKDMIPENERLRSERVQYATVEKQRAITNSSRKNEASGPKRKQCSVMDVSGVKVKSNAVKNNIAKESEKLGPLKKNSFGIFNALCSL